MKPKREYPYYFDEELANAISHGIGGVLAVAALALLVLRGIWYAPADAQATVVFGCAIFGVSLVLVYLSSTLYHAFMHTSLRDVFKAIDQLAIYLLIAGSYTFFCLSLLRGPVGYRILAEIWVLAGIGIFIHLFFREKFGWLSLVMYLLMGWLALPEFPSLIKIASAPQLGWIVAGGIAYTVGSIFYSVKRKWMHFIWHLFVLAGSACHVLAACYIL